MPPSDTERYFFSFWSQHYDYNEEFNVLVNFVRLAQEQRWELGSQEWRHNWNACFGRTYTNNQNPYVPTAHSNPRLKDCVQKYSEETAQDDRQEDRKEEFDKIRKNILFRGWTTRS